MYEAEFVVQDPSIGKAGEIIAAIEKIGSAADFSQIRVAVAYATERGCELLADALKSQLNWRSLQKRWLLSIDFGHTEPEALRRLTKLSKSAVRVSDGNATLARKLRPARTFHPKTYVLETSDTQTLAMFTGSSNLTFSGMCAGVEHGIGTVWTPQLRSVERERLIRTQTALKWWNTAWDAATPVDAGFIQEYAAVRPKKIITEDNVQPAHAIAESENPVIPRENALNWANARCFWIQTYERMRGGAKEGNQLDCRRGTRTFFGFPPARVAKNHRFGNVSIQFQNRPPVERGVRFGKNGMDKVNLPTPGDDGPPNYDNTYLHFERIGMRQFRVTLAQDDNEVEQWRAASRAQGMYETFAREREFGFYS